MTTRTTRKDLRPNNPVATVLAPYAAYCRQMANGYELRPPSSEESPERTAGRIEGLRQAAGILEQGRAIAIDINAEELLAQAAALEAANETLGRTSLIVADLATKVAASVGKVAPPVAPQKPPPTSLGQATPRSLREGGLLGQHAPEFRRPEPPGNTFTPPEAPGLERCERALLGVLRARHPELTSRPTLAFLAGYSPESSSYANALGALRSEGLVEDAPGDEVHRTLLRATSDGLRAMIPWQLPDVASYWCDKLDKCEAALLRVMLEQGTATREQLAEWAGYSHTSSSFVNALGRLRKLEICERAPSTRLTADFREAVKWAEEARR